MGIEAYCEEYVERPRQMLVVSPRNYGLSEEAHLILIHILTQYLKNELAGKPDERVPV